MRISSSVIRFSKEKQSTPHEWKVAPYREAASQHLQLLQWNRHTSTHSQLPPHNPSGKASAKNHQLMWRLSHLQWSFGMLRPLSPFYSAAPARLHLLWDPKICFRAQELLQTAQSQHDGSCHQSSKQGFSSDEEIQICGQHCRSLGQLFPRPRQFSMNKSDLKADSVSSFAACLEQQTS